MCRFSHRFFPPYGHAVTWFRILFLPYPSTLLSHRVRLPHTQTVYLHRIRLPHTCTLYLYLILILLLIPYTNTLYWYLIIIPFTSTLYWYLIIRTCTYTVCLYFIVIPFTYILYLYRVLIPYAYTVRRQYRRSKCGWSSMTKACPCGTTCTPNERLKASSSMARATSGETCGSTLRAQRCVYLGYHDTDMYIYIYTYIYSYMFFLVHALKVGEQYGNVSCRHVSSHFTYVHWWFFSASHRSPFHRLSRTNI